MLDRLGVRCFASIAIRGFPPTNVLSRRMWGFTSAIPAGRTPMLPVFYLHLEPDNCFAAAGIWHPDNRTLTRVRSAIVSDSDRWAAFLRKLELEGDKLSRPPKGFDRQHPFIEDLKMKDFVASVTFTEDQICGSKFLRQFTSACRKMSPLVEFTTKALGLKY